MPQGWKWVKLGGKFGVADIINGSTPATDNPQYWDGDILWATPSDISKLNSIYIDNTERKITESGLASCSTSLLPAGTILLTSRAPVGNIAIANKEICTNQGFKSFKPKATVDSLYLYFAIKAIIPEIIKQSHGNTFVEITKDLIQHFEVPLPPSVNEQKNIATKLEKRRHEIEEMRQAALRQKGAAEVMQGAILRKIFPFKEGDVLPDGWKWSELGRISANIQYGISKGASQTPSGPKLLRITDIQNGNVDWSSVPYCECNDNETRRYLLQDGDIVFVRTGATTGKSFLINTPDNALFASYLIRVQCNHNFINPAYLYSFFQSPIYWNYISQGSRGGTLAGFNATMLSKMRIPYPIKLDDQISIANIFVQKMIGVEKLRLAANRQLEAIEAMPAAVLREVFDFDAETGAAI